MVVPHLRTVPSSAARCFASADFASLCVLEASAASRPPMRAVLPHWAYFALLRPQGARFVRPPATTTSTIRNGRLAAPDGLQYFLAHWAYYGLFRAPRAAFVRPYQFPLKSCGFPGAETARKRFLLWKMGFSGAKIAPSPPYTPPGTIEAREGRALRAPPYTGEPFGK